MPESHRTAGPAAVEKCGIKAHEGKLKHFLFFSCSGSKLLKLIIADEKLWLSTKTFQCCA